MTASNQDEETLDRDFALFLSMTKTYYQEIVNDKDKDLCRQWLDKLCGKKVRGVSQKRSRNILLSQLIMNMQKKKLSERFLNPPTDDLLPSTSSIFGIFEAYSQENDNVEGEFEDFQERSADGRTYVAIRCLPDSRGTYAFVALNIDKEEDELGNKIIIPRSIDKSELEHSKAMQKLKKDSYTICDNPSENQMEDFYFRNIDARVAGNNSQLRKKARARCGKDKKEINFIDLLLKQIDEEIKGVASGDNRLVEYLLTKLTEDLKRMPKMKYIFELKPDHQRLKLLQILRQKLIVRLQEEKRKNIVADMEESILASAFQPECCQGEVEEPAESVWELMIKKPLNDNDLKKLQDIYPQELISSFIDILAEDRRIILERGRKRQNKMIKSMRSEVYKEINSGKAEYNEAHKANREWIEILSKVEETMYEAGIQEEDQVEEQAKFPHQNEKLLEEMIANVKDTESLIKEEARHGEELTEEIKAAKVWKLTFSEDTDQEMWELKEMIDNLKEQVELYKIMVKKQEQRIKELRQRLEYD